MNTVPDPFHLHAVSPAAVAGQREVIATLGRDPLEWIPDGAYSAACTDRPETRWQFDRYNLWLWFSIVSHDERSARFHGTRIPLICPMAAKGRFAPGSRFVRIWTEIMNRRPTRRDRLSTAVFMNKLFTIQTRTVSTDHRQKPLAFSNRYSVVAEILSVDVGTLSR